VGGFWNSGRGRGNPIERGFDHAFCCNDGNAFEPRSIHYDQQTVEVEDGFYSTDAISDYAVRMLQEHGREHPARPFFLHLCYTVPHFPLHAKPQDIAKYRGKFRDGWDAVRQRRFGKQKKLGLFAEDCRISPRDPLARPWKEVPEEERDEWDLRMAVHAAMVDCMDQGVGRVLEAIDRLGARQNTLVLFCSDNGASAEFLDTWPDPRRGHKPGSITGTAESHRCLEVGWSNAANTPFREHKIWVHEGGIATPLIAYWPKGITARGAFTDQVAHLIDFMPTCLELVGVEYPSTFNGYELARPEGQSLVPVFRGNTMGHRTLAWEHEGNRAIRVGDWKLVARYQDHWELYNLEEDFVCL
jgi:arylsulfatase